MTKYVIYTVLLTITAASAAWLESRSEQFEPAPARVELGNRVYATGVVEGATEDVHLQPEVSGRVLEVLVDVGAWVNAGDVLLRLDDSRQRQEVAASEANLESASAQLQRLVNGARPQERAHAHALLTARQARLLQAQRTWKRVQELRSQAAVSQQEYDDQEGLVEMLHAEAAAAQAEVDQIEAPARVDEVRAAEARVAAARADLELARIALEKTLLRAPSKGQLLDLDAEVGELLSVDSLTPAIILSDTSQLRVRAFVEEIDAPRLTVGMPVEIRADGLVGKVFTGRVESLSPRMAPKSFASGNPNEMFDTKVREVLIALEAGEKLLVGLRVDAMFTLNEVAVEQPRGQQE